MYILKLHDKSNFEWFGKLIEPLIEYHQNKPFYFTQLRRFFFQKPGNGVRHGSIIITQKEFLTLSKEKI